MSTGISISSINRIKELAEERKYAEALEILDTQNLDMSINPQFLRISGEIFRENKRYYDSRRILIKAHEMAPQGTRIISELIELHLELGHLELANKYYEEYMFYSTEDDAQRDYVEYIMKKASGSSIEELASILIPVLENMPDDKWSFEAVLLYDKLGRKDKALEESQYILENFKESIYIKPVVEYIDDELDVDEYFYVYPKEEIPDDKELYRDLIEKETKVLESDHLRMYPPEARIMVQADDKEADELRPVKEKKPKKKKNKKKKSQDDADEEIASDKKDSSESSKDATDNDKGISDDNGGESETSDPGDKLEEEQKLAEEERKQEREAALERILSKKLDKDAVKESAKQVAHSVNIDSDKAIAQVKSVKDSVKNNVKKATDTIGGAVGSSMDKLQLQPDNSSEEIMDGIIESVLEPPKKSVGQVVTNEELDALIPDSLEAMSADEVADIEARKEEQERAELEALEASLRLEEEKRNKRKKTTEDKESHSDSNEKDFGLSDIVKKDTPIPKEKIASVSFAELKARFLENQAEEAEDEEPLESLGFITVVQSDVDKDIEGNIPEAADILHRMIDNKEFYSGENSRGFESKASYDRHDFEVEDYSFREYIEDDIDEEHFSDDIDNIYKVEDIFADESLLLFDDMIPESLVETARQRENVTELVVDPEPVKTEPEESVVEPEPVKTEPVESAVDPEPVKTESVESIVETEKFEPKVVEAAEPNTEVADEAFSVMVESDSVSVDAVQTEIGSDEVEEAAEPKSEVIDETVIVESEVRWQSPDKVDEPDEPVVKVVDDDEELGWSRPFDEPQYFTEESDEIKITKDIDEEYSQSDESIDEEYSVNVENASDEYVESDNIVEAVENVETADDTDIYDKSNRDMLRFRIILTDAMINSLSELKESR